MKKFAVAVAVLLCAAGALADTVGAHLVTVHDRPGFNGVNPGLYWRGDGGLTAGAYRNSENRDSVYGGYTWTGCAWSLSALVVAGYKAGTVPALVPSYAFGLGDGVSVRASLVLNPMKGGASGVHASVEYRI